MKTPLLPILPLKSCLAILTAQFLVSCEPILDSGGDRSFGSEGEFTLRGDYGTLAYEGEAVRTVEQGVCMIRIPKLKLTFVPRARTNRTDRIEATLISLVATKQPPSGEGPWTILAEDTHNLSINLTSSSPTVDLSDIELKIPAAAVESADHLGLRITDGRLLWPLGGELKEP